MAQASRSALDSLFGGAPAAETPDRPKNPLDDLFGK